jgi:hypothetical protein
MFGFSGIRDLHGETALKLSDGAIYKIISEGQKSSPTEAGMMGYASNIDIADRWAIVAYVRALQLSRLGDAKKDNVPARFLIPEKKPEAPEVEEEGTE